ncbi:MAG: hypothetical protein Q8O37_05865 [Sulfuricellaceae bacterium]|nr:hypothetical protein [Sulfuricellaceae bacterium]
MKDVSRHYDKLTPQERLALTVEAMARGDTEESDRLLESCPKQIYRINDPEFSWRFARLISLALMNLVDSYQTLAKANRALAAYARSPDDERMESYFHYKTEQFSIQEAWKRFCDSLGLDDDKVFTAFRLDVSGLQRTRLDLHIVLDEEVVGILFEGMREAWESA